MTIDDDLWDISETSRNLDDFKHALEKELLGEISEVESNKVRVNDDNGKGTM